MTKSLYNRNLLKSGWVNVNQEEVRVIDSNKAIEEKMASSGFPETGQEAEPYLMQSFDEDAEQSDSMDALFADNPEVELMQAEQMSEDDGRLSQASAQAQEIIAQAQAQAQEICQQAQAMAQQDAKKAYDDAYRQGMQDGYSEGIQKANAESEAALAQYAQKEEQLQRQYEQRLEEMEPYLIRELTGIYEHVFEVELSQYRNILQHLIASTLRAVEMSEHYLVHVSEQDYSYVSMQKPQIIEEGCVKNSLLEIVEDRTLAKNECLIETESGIFDCSLSVQLTELKRKLQLLSYTGKKE